MARTVFTIIADIGQFAAIHPPILRSSCQTGSLRCKFIAANPGHDGHHNRVYRVTRDGEVSELIAFDEIVPTGLAVLATPSTWPKPARPPRPQDGKIVAVCAGLNQCGRNRLRGAPPCRRGIRAWVDSLRPRARPLPKGLW